jgi:hypothetical protein
VNKQAGILLACLFITILSSLSASYGIRKL